MIVVKKVDNENNMVTISNNGTLQSIDVNEFLTVPKVDDVVEPQRSEDGSTKFVALSTATLVDRPAKSKLVAGLLGIFLGTLGIHNFYLGNSVKGVIQLLIGLFGWVFLVGWIATLWGFIEGVIILLSKKGSNWHKDGQGNELRD